MLSKMDGLAMVCAAVAAFCAVWGVTHLAAEFWKRWQERLVAETELEVEEMLMQLPTAKILNYGVIIAGITAGFTFLIISTLGKGFHWQAGLLFGGLVFLLLCLLPRYTLRVLRRRRLERFNDQLEEALTSMSNSLKAGFSIIQSIEAVVKQNRQPISIEFKLMMQQTQLGMSLDEALFNMARRVASEDFYLVASAIATARVTGGDLTGVFERLSTMIRERMRIQRRIRTLTAQGRLQALVLGGLPMLLLFVLFLIAPEKIINFFTRPLGLAIFGVVLALETCGFLIIRRIIAIDI